MFKFFRHAVRGAGYLEGYGHHPGTTVLFYIALACGVAGVSSGGLQGFITGFILGGVFMLPFYIVGCVDRSKSYDKSQQRLLKMIKDA